MHPLHVRIAFLATLLACAVVPGAVALDGDMAFAQSLLSERDYFRAITELKRVKFSTADPALRELCDMEIGQAYLWSNRYDLSISVLGGLLSTGVVDPGRLPVIDLFLGLDYVGLRTFPIAQDYFTRALNAGDQFFPLLYLGLVQAQSGSWKDSESFFGRAQAAAAAPDQVDVSRRLQDAARRGSTLRQKSPLLSGLLSAVVPGAGQVYTGHYVDAAQAFVAVGALSFATYGLYLYDSRKNDSYILTGLGVAVTAMFHAANIYGAAKTADYYNFKQKEDLLADMKETAFSIQPEVK